MIAGVSELYAYLADAFAARAAQPRDDLLSRLMKLEGGERLGEVELFWFCLLLLVAGKNWASREKRLRALTMFMQEVAPRLAPLQADRIPEPVLARAREILGNLERQQLDVGGRPKIAEKAGEPPPREVQLDLFRGQGEVVLDALQKIDLEKTTPLVALNLLASFQARLRGES